LQVRVFRLKMRHVIRRFTSLLSTLLGRGRRGHLDLTLRVHPRVRTRVIERPGEWMSAQEQAALVADLRGLVSDGIGDELHYGVVAGDPERLKQAVITLLHDRVTGRLVAFNALSFMPVQLRGRDSDVLHLGLVVVDPSYRAQGMSWILYGLTCILIFFRRGLRPLWISNVTQVPSIVGKVAESFATPWAKPIEPTRRSFDHLSVAREIMTHHRPVFGVGPEAGFDEERFVITNAYTGGSDNLKKTWEQAPKHRDARVNALCERELDYARGDDFLQLARFDLAAARRYLMRDVPRNSLPALLYPLAFLLLSHVFLPVVHWLNPMQAMGDLRART
jgi:hypothetical protein